MNITESYEGENDFGDDDYDENADEHDYDDDDTGDDKASAPRGKSACAKRGLLGRATALASERALNEHRFLSPVHESDAAIEAVLHC